MTKQRLLMYILLLGAGGVSAQTNFSSDWGNYMMYLDKANTNSNDARVDEFTGTASYGFLFCNLNAGGSSFPVGMSYQSNGTRVDEYASNIGLGWNLNAGGSITRIVKGLDDNHSNGSTIVGFNNPASGVTWDGAHIHNGEVDGEKDYFSFSAFGLSGNFYEAVANTTYYPLGGEDIVIQRENAGASNDRFIITDNRGTKYYFALKEKIYMYVNSSTTASSISDGNWFLTKVVMVDGKEVELLYDTKTVTRLKTSVSELDEQFYDYDDAPCSGYSGCETQLMRTLYTTFESYRLSEIRGDQETVLFSYSSTARTDITDDYALSMIEYKVNNVRHRKYLLEQDYHSGRLMLNRVFDITGSMSFNIPLLTLQYNETYTVPAPFSMQSQDRFGYYNGTAATKYCLSPEVNSNTLLEYQQDPHVNSSYAYNHIEGANRSIGTAAIVSSLMLTKVETGYGKVQELSYESNSYDQAVQNQNGWVHTAVPTYGVRVKKVVTYNTSEPSKKITTIYSYENQHGHSAGMSLAHSADRNIGRMFSYGCQGIFRQASSGNKKTYILNGVVVYHTVKTLSCTDPNDIANTTIGSVVRKYSTDHLSVTDVFSNVLWLVRKHRWGNLESEVHYNKSNAVIDSTNYIYTYSESTFFTCLYPILTGRNNSGNVLGTFYYRLTPGVRLLSEVRRYTFNSAAQSMGTIKSVYTHDSKNHISRTDLYRNNILLGKTYYKYPYNYTVAGTVTNINGLAVAKMNEKNITSQVLETITTKLSGSNEHVLNAGLNLFKYDATSQQILPAASYGYKKLNPVAYGSFTQLSFNTNGVPAYSGNYSIATEMMSFDKAYYPTEVKINNTVTNATLNTPSGDVFCVVTNATLAECGYLGFESYETAEFMLTGNPYLNKNWMLNYPNCFANAIVAGGVTGDYAYDFSQCMGGTFYFSGTLESGKRYKMQYWQKDGTLNVVPDNSGTVSAAKTLRTLNGWTLIEREITGCGSITIGSTSAKIDELRLFPYGSTMSSISFDALNQRTSECDENNRCTFYEYDELMRVHTIKDEYKNIIKRIEYGIQIQE